VNTRLITEVFLFVSCYVAVLQHTSITCKSVESTTLETCSLNHNGRRNSGTITKASQPVSSLFLVPCVIQRVELVM